MRIAPHLRATFVTLILCMLLSGNPAAIVDPLALLFIALLAWIAHRSPRLRQATELLCLVGVPVGCVFAAVGSPSFQGAGAYLAFGMCGSVYGLTWFGLESDTPDPAWRRWTTAVPVLTLLGSALPVFRGPGLGSAWIIQAVIATAAVVFVAIWRRDTNQTAIRSFAAAVTLCLGVRTFQIDGQPNALDLGLVFLPYVTSIFASLAGQTARLLHHSADTQPISEQLRPLR